MYVVQEMDLTRANSTLSPIAHCEKQTLTIIILKIIVHCYVIIGSVDLLQFLNRSRSQSLEKL
jgi:hypothetical protein